MLTHAHADHSGGARAFAAAGARVICHESIAGQIVAFVGQAATDPNDPMAGKTNVRPVVESISERAILVDGIHNIQISFLGAAHTKGDLVVYLVTEKILFPGDLALNGRLPFMQSPDVDSQGWTRALEALARVPVDKMVPGHGDIGPKTGLADSHAYVKRVDELARKFMQQGLQDEGDRDPGPGPREQDRERADHRRPHRQRQGGRQGDEGEGDPQGGGDPGRVLRDAGRPGPGTKQPAPSPTPR